MTRKTAAAAALLTVQALILGASTAQAEEVEGSRLLRLERLLELQAAELERMHARLEELEELEEPAPSPAVQPPPVQPRTAPPAPPTVTPTAPIVPPGVDLPPSGRPSSKTPRKASFANPAADREAFPAPADKLELDRTANRLQRKMDEAGIDPFAQVGPSVRLGGYLTLEYIAPSDQNSWFDLHRFVLQADAVITDGVDMVTEIEYEHGGIGGGADGDVEIEYLEVAFRPHDVVQLKVGAILIPFGRFNLYHDDPFNDFTKRPWIARYFVPTGFGQPGIGVEGAIRVGCDGVLTYDTALTTGFGEAPSSSGGVRPMRQSWRGDNNENKQVWGRIAYDPGRSFLDRLEVGASGTFGYWDDQDDHSIFGWGIDLLARKGPFELQGEYMRYELGQDVDAAVTEPRGMDGLWLQAGFHFFPSFLCGCGAPFVTDTSHFTLAVRYQSMDLNDRIRGASFNDDSESWGIALNYRITEQTVFRIDQSWITAVNEPDKQEFTASFSTWF